jgi:hypothetical protein
MSFMNHLYREVPTERYPRGRGLMRALQSHNCQHIIGSYDGTDIRKFAPRSLQEVRVLYDLAGVHETSYIYVQLKKAQAASA